MRHIILCLNCISTTTSCDRGEDFRPYRRRLPARSRGCRQSWNASRQDRPERTYEAQITSARRVAGHHLRRRVRSLPPLRQPPWTPPRAATWTGSSTASTGEKRAASRLTSTPTGSAPTTTTGLQLVPGPGNPRRHLRWDGGCTDGRAKRCEPGDVVVIDSNDGHATLTTQPHTTVLLLHIDASYLAGFTRDDSVPRFSRLSAGRTRDQPGFARLRMLLARMMLASDRPGPGNEATWKAGPLSIVATLFDHFPPEPSREPATDLPAAIENHRALRREVAYMDQSFRERVTFDLLAQHSSLSPAPSARGRDLLQVPHSRAAAPGGFGLPPKPHLAHGRRGHTESAPLNEATFWNRP